MNLSTTLQNCYNSNFSQGCNAKKSIRLQKTLKTFKFSVGFKWQIFVIYKCMCVVCCASPNNKIKPDLHSTNLLSIKDILIKMLQILTTGIYKAKRLRCAF